MMWRLLTLLTCLSHITFSQTAVTFRESDFPPDRFTIKKEQRSLEAVVVEIIQVKPNKSSEAKQFSCRAWLTVKTNGKTTKALVEDMESVGGCSGFYFPEEQPAKNLILVSKFGDYDGRLFMVDTKGEVRNYLGGKFYVSSDNKYLFSNYDSDLSGVTIVDLTNNEVVYTAELKQYLGDWYFQDGQFFTRVSDDVMVGGEIKTLRFDFKTSTFAEKKTTQNIDQRNKLRIYNDLAGARDCNCGR